jgi:hypothetical protein
MITSFIIHDSTTVKHRKNLSLCKLSGVDLARYLARLTLLELGRASSRETVAG